MVFNGKRFAALGVDGSDVLLYFLESALNFPACGVKLNHLFCRKRKVGGDQRKSNAFVIYENDFDLTSERLGYAEQLGKFYFAVFAVSGVVKPDQQAACHSGIAHNSGEESPQGIPWQLSGIEKVVELLEGGVTREQQREFSENTTDPAGAAASAKSDNDSFEDDLAIGGNYRRCPIEKLVEFHVRLLSRLNEHEENIAQEPCRCEAISTCNTIIYSDRFDIAKWLLTA